MFFSRQVKVSYGFQSLILSREPGFILLSHKYMQIHANTCTHTFCEPFVFASLKLTALCWWLTLKTMVYGFDRAFFDFRSALILPLSSKCNIYIHSL